MGILRMVGVDTPALKISQQGAAPQAQKPGVTDSAAGRLADAQGAVDKMYDIQRQNNESQSQTWSQVAAAKGKPQWIQDFANLSDTVMQGAKIIQGQKAAQEAAIAQQKQIDLEYAKQVERASAEEARRMQEDRIAKAKAAEETRKLVQQDTYSLVNDRLQSVILSMGDLVRKGGQEQGFLEAKRQVDEVLADKKGDLDPKDYRALKDFSYGELRKLDNSQTERLFEQSKQIRNSLADQAFAVFRSQTVDIFNRYATAQTPEELDSADKALTDKFIEIGKDPRLNAREKLDIQTKLLTEATQRKGVSVEAQTRLNNSLTATLEYSKEFEQLNELRDSGQMDENQYRTALGYLNNLASSKGVKGLQTEAPLLTSDGLEKLGLDKLIVINQLQEHAEKAANKEATAALNDISAIAVGASAFQILENPHMRTQIQATKNPQMMQALELADRFKAEADATQVLQTEVGKLSVTMARLAGRVDPSRVSTKSRQYDPVLGGFKDIEGAALPTASPEEYKMLEDRMTLLKQQITEKVQYWGKYGLNAVNPRDQSMLKSQEYIEKKTEAIRDGAKLPPGVLPSNLLNAQGIPVDSPFKRATAQGQPASPPVANFKKLSYNGRQLTLPIPAKYNPGHLEVSSPYGQRGGRLHGGIDIAIPTGTPMVTLGGGVVVDAGENLDPRGYGSLVAVKTPSGHVELYAHLDTVSVKTGQRIPPGYMIGKSGGDEGARGAGSSRGAHLHFSVFKPGGFNAGLVTTYENSIDPVQYMTNFKPSRVNQLSFGIGQPRGVGSPGLPTSGKLPPGMSPVVVQALRRAGIDPNNIQMTGNMKLNSVQYTVDPYTGVAAETGSLTGGRKMNYQQKRMSLNKKDYPPKNDPNESYGYKELESDKPFLREVAVVADRLGMPAVWLLDVMRFESFNTRTGKAFDPSVVNQIGATGLIQFMPETAQGLGTSTSELARMSRVQQMKYVEKYFQEIKGKIKAPGDVLAFIFGGYGLFSKPESRRQSIGDGQMTYGKYVRELGQFVGRSYAY